MNRLLCLLLFFFAISRSTFAAVDLDSIKVNAEVVKVSEKGIWIVSGKKRDKKLFVDKKWLQRPPGQYTKSLPVIIKFKYEDYLSFHKKNFASGVEGGSGAGG